MRNTIGTYTLFMRETRRFMKVWLQTILAPVVSNLLFLTVFGLSLSRSVQTVEGLSYLQFIVPGLIIMGILNNSYQNPSSSMVIMKYQGLIADLLTIPLSHAEILLAFTASAVFRGLLVGAITFATALFFTTFPFTSVLFILLAALLVALFFSFLGLLMGIWAREFDQVAFVTNFVLMPLTFLGGVFYPTTNLPEVFAKLSAVNPIVYMIDLLRYGFTGVHEFPLALSLGITTALTTALGLLSYFVIRSGWRMQT